MKRIVSVVLAVVLVLALGIGIYYYKIIARLPIEKIIPEGAVAYVRISDIEKGLQEFKSTRLWRNIRDIEIELLLEKSGLSQEEIVKYDMLKSELFRSAAELLLDKFFGQEIALALYPDKTGTFDLEKMPALASNIILVTRLKPEAEFIEFISKLCSKFGQKMQIKHEEYKGRQVTIVELADEVNIAYVKIRDLLVVGLGKKGAFACLDVVAKDKAAFSQDEAYILTGAQLPRQAQTIAFGNLKLLLSNIKQALDKIPESKEITLEQKAKILESFDKTAGLKTVGFSSISGKISRDKIVMTFDKTGMDLVLARSYSFKPQKNSTIDFVPKDIIGYQWNNCFDAKLNWDSFKQELSKTPERFPQGASPEEIIAGIEQALGMNIEYDIIPALGNEMGGFLSDINLNGPVPVPELLLFVKIKDKTAIEKVIGTLSEKNNLLMRSEEYKNVSIKYISLPFGKTLQPGYCFLNEYLLISTGTKLLKGSIDTLSGESMSLLANKDFRAVDFGLTDENNAVFFLKTDRLLLKIREICEWGFAWASLMSANLEAYQGRAKQYLDDLRANIQIKEQDLKWVKTNSQSLKEGIGNLQSQGLDVSSRQRELDTLQAKIEKTEEEITQAKKELEEKEQEFQNMIQNSPVARIDLTLVRLYLDEAVYPILDGFETIKAMGSRSVFSEDMLTVHSFSKSEE